MASTSSTTVEIDEDHQSRQLAVYGRMAMGKLRECHVLISGMNGLGAEVAKNVVLANVASVTLHDTGAVQIQDLGSHFYLSEEDVGKNRAQVSVPRFQELNTGVRVKQLEGELTVQALADFTVVVLIDAPEQFALEADAFCRSQPKPIAFVRASVAGLAGAIFTDFGDEFVVLDPNDEPPKTAIVANILDCGHVSCVEGERVDFEDGDMAVFSEVEGMDELNDGKPRKLVNCNMTGFDIEGGVEGLGTYIRGGIVTQRKVPITLNFRPLSAVLEEPGQVEPSDFSKFGRAELLHRCFRALDAFRAAHDGAFPRPAHEEDAAEVLAWVQAEAARTQDFAVDEHVVKEFAFCSSAVLNPMAALFGGLVGQEVIKAATGKFHPIFQQMFLDSFESLPEQAPPAAERQPVGSRYDHQLVTFGARTQQKLGELTTFLVGSGALGCEFLKNFAMMGVACGGGSVTVTDDDVIEKSNLSRQFLFRNWHVGAGKSEVAAAAAQAMNAKLQVKVLQERVSPHSEDVFNDEFWRGLDVVVNALDNVKARRYVDTKCVFYEKPLLESGTQGPKCNTLVCLPHRSENYAAQPDAPEKQTPECTLHNFPHNIQHCLSWGRSDFVGQFEVLPSCVVEYMKAGSKLLENLRVEKVSDNDISEKLERIETAVRENPATFADCIRMARFRFEELFANRVKQLTFTFPEDAVTDAGLPFWSPPKRFPHPLQFDPADEEHMRFVVSGANLYARIFHVEIPQSAGAAAAREAARVPEDSPPENRDLAYFRAELAKIDVPPFEPKKGLKIKVDEKDRTPSVTIASTEIEARFARLPAPDALPFSKVTPEDFEKDHDWNFHMDYVGSLGNLRARCYQIKEVDKLEAKLTAGRIIPAIATATACATGLVMLELYKIVNERNVGTWNTVGAFRNAYLNLSDRMCTMSDTQAPAQIESRKVKVYPDPIGHPDYFEEEEVVAIPNPHTVWDRIEVRLDNPTIRQVMEFFKEKYDVTVVSITISTPSGKAPLLYHSAMKKTHERLDEPIVAAFERMGKTKVTKDYVLPDIYCTTADFEDVDFPTIILYYR